ncbi:MAG TPA: hypothetical protein VE911_02975 [Candidatus Nitrosopolaris sp.]|nr:hypothetical protein [Candidatus Nitrosopolaris sp.]
MRYQDHEGKIVKKKVGPKALAQRVYKKLSGKVAEKRHFPDPPPPPPPPWDPPFAERIDDYLARTASTRRDPQRAQHFAHYFKTAPETVGKTMRTLTREDFELYRERRLRGGLAGAQRQRGKASPTTVNKELSFARAVFYDFIAALEDRRLAPIPNPVRQDRTHSIKDPFVAEPKHRTQYLTDEEESRLRASLSADAWPVVAFSLLTGLDRGGAARPPMGGGRSSVAHDHDGASEGTAWRQTSSPSCGRSRHAYRARGCFRMQPVPAHSMAGTSTDSSSGRHCVGRASRAFAGRISDTASRRACEWSTSRFRASATCSATRQRA